MYRSVCPCNLLVFIRVTQLTVCVCVCVAREHTHSRLGISSALKQLISLRRYVRPSRFYSFIISPLIPLMARGMSPCARLNECVAAHTGVDKINHGRVTVMTNTRCRSEGEAIYCTAATRIQSDLKRRAVKESLSLIVTCT